MANNPVIVNSTSITLDWEDVPSATKYKLQISEFIDFSSLELEAEPTLSTYTHTLTGGEKQYYWRWRPYVSGYTESYPWHAVSSFIYNSNMPGNFIAIPQWVFVRKDTVSSWDKYQFEIQPLSYSITPEHINRTRSRNLAGELLTEYVSTKTEINLDFSRQLKIGVNQKAEFFRFFNLHESFYLCKQFEDLDVINTVSKIWEVEYRSGFSSEFRGLSIRLEEV